MSVRLLSGPLFHPDPDPPADIPPTKTPTDEQTPASGGPSEPQESGPLDLSQQVKLEDGTTVSVGDLVQARRDAEAAQQRLQSYEQTQTALRLIADDSAPIEQREEAQRILLREQGYSDEQIAGMMNPPDDGQDGTAMTTEREREMQARLDKLEQQQVESRKRQIREKFDDVLATTLDSDPGVVTLLEGIRRRAEQHGEDVDKTVADAKNTIRAQLDSHLRANLMDRTSSENTFDVAWIGQAAGGAVKSVLDSLRPVIGSPEQLGRGPETVVGTGHDILNTKPVPKPDLDKAPDMGAAEAQLDAHINDTLMRSAAEKALDGAS